MPSTFPHGTLVSGYEASADAFPTLADTAQWWLVDLVSVGTPVPVNPTVTSAFSSGVWTGNLAVLKSAAQMENARR